MKQKKTLSKCQTEFTPNRIPTWLAVSTTTAFWSPPGASKFIGRPSSRPIRRPSAPVLLIAVAPVASSLPAVTKTPDQTTVNLGYGNHFIIIFFHPFLNTAIGTIISTGCDHCDHFNQRSLTHNMNNQNIIPTNTMCLTNHKTIRCQHVFSKILSKVKSKINALHEKANQGLVRDKTQSMDKLFCVNLLTSVFVHANWRLSELITIRYKRIHPLQTQS